MKINVYEFKGSQLAAMPENERILLVQFAHLSNCISMLYKYVFYTATPPSSETIIEEEFAAQHYFFIRIFAGILNEGWECVKKSYFGTKLSLNQYKITPECDSLKFIKEYFNKENAVHTIRDKFSFHFDMETIKDMLNENNEFHDNTFNICFDSAGGIGTSLFNFSENIIAWSMFHRISKEKEADYMGAFKAINKEVMDIAKHFMIFTHKIIALIMKKHLGDNDGNFIYKTLDIERETINNVKIPFFVSRPEEN